MPLKRNRSFKETPKFETIEELLAVATGEVISTTDPVNEKEQQVRGFILDLQLSAGDSCIPAAYVFSSFLTWAASPLSKHTFSRYFNQYFKPHVTRGFIYYRLNKGALGLPDDYSCWTDKTIQYIYKDPLAKYVGVLRDYTNNTFRVDFNSGTKHVTIPGFSTPHEAALAYDKYVIENNLTKRPLNFYDAELVWKPFKEIYEKAKKTKEQA